MIEVEGLTKRYDSFTAVDNVSFRVERGEILGFLGPNAAGKTTTMRVLTGYHPPSEGTVRVAGFDILDQGMEAKKKIGYLPERIPLYHDMTVRTYLDFVGELKGLPRHERRGSVGRAMERAGLEDVTTEIIGKLSRGFRQRVAIAQSIVHNPEVIVLDEPTLGLDPSQIIQVRNLIRSLGGEHTVILSTHILPEVSMTCNRVVIINKGKLVAEGTPDELTSRLKGAERVYIEVACDDRTALTDLLGSSRGVTGVELTETFGDDRFGFIVESKLSRDVRPQVAAAVVGAGYRLLELRYVGLSLEEIFLELTTEEEPPDREAAVARGEEKEVVES